MKRLTLLILVALQGCSNFSASIYTGVDKGPVSREYPGPIAIFEAQAHLEADERFNCKYIHRSDVFKGFPINGSDEFIRSEIGVCGFTYKFGENDD